MADMGVVVRAAGGPEALEWTELETPAPAAGEVRIVQRAVGVNFIDTYFRSGLYPWPTTPLVPGAEASGLVEDVGPGVTGLKSGDRVAYTMPLGAYRTRRVVPADRLVKLPEAISYETAASVMLKGLTAQFLLTSCFPVKAGQTVLVHAAAGGVGLLLGQWLKLLGATTIGTVGSAAKVDIAKANGYAHVIQTQSEDFTARVEEITGGGRCDVVYDSVGKDAVRWVPRCWCPAAGSAVPSGFLDDGHGHRGVHRLHAGNARQVVQIEGFIGFDVARDDFQQKVPLAGEGVALQHFGAIANGGLEFGDGVAAGGRQLDVREHGDVQSQGVAIEQGHARLDDAVLLELLNAPPAGGGGKRTLRGDLGHRQRALPL
jgi:NADPH:quinone reductase-like Zn-dependent oxidoreductase